MIQGTTPTHRFRLPFGGEMVAALSIAYAQHGEVLVKKTLNDCTVDGNEITVKLSQAETLKFSDGSVRIQLRVLTPGGDAPASKTWTIPVDEVLDKEVLT